MILLPGLLFILWGEPGRCRGEDGGFTFDGDIRHFAVATNSVYIATEERLYQLSHNLTLVQSRTQRGFMKDGAIPPVEEHFYRVSEVALWNATFSVNVLLPFVENGTLISCGVTDDNCGYCEVLDLMNISKLVHRESIHVGPLRRSSASVSVLVTVEKSPTQRHFYILTAIQKNHQEHSGPSRCRSSTQTLNLQNTDEKQSGGIFSFNDDHSRSSFESKGDLEFVDGFQISSTLYLLSNVPSGSKSNKVRLIWFEGKTNKIETVKSLRGATLSVSEGGGDGNRLLASSLIPGGPPVLWSGVFSVDEGQLNTKLVVFDISPDLSGEADADPDFCSDCNTKQTVKKTLKPEAVLFRQNHMTSVLAVRQKAWMVFFIGTGDGQLIKLAVDKKYHTVCPTVLYRADDDRRVFPKIQLDQVDRKHVYVPFQNKMERVPVSTCSTYKNVQECWSAQDPYCVWCDSKSCTFEDDCKDSDWVSIPDDYQQKMVSHNVAKDSTGQITLNILTHLTAGEKARSNFACQFLVRSRELCRKNNFPPQFPQCICILSENILPAEGLAVSVRIRLGSLTLLEPLTLTNCSDIRGPPTSVLCQQCIRAGCGWSKNHCSWANQGVRNDSLCQMMGSGMNFSRPEISSITPSVVSFYGRNHAVLSGHNLSDVTRVRIQTEDCSPRESPVWNNTGVNLTFHIPSTQSKGVVKVCALLPDGSCHGNMKITYSSLPFCANITPSSAWDSGKRKITLMGSHLEFVERVTHSHAPQEVRLPRNSNFQSLTYDAPAAGNLRGTFTSTVFLKVANETLSCSTKITYYPDPEFTSFTSTRMGDNLRITIEKKADKLEMTTAEFSVWCIQAEKQYPCIMVKETVNKTDFFTCVIQHTSDAEFQHFMITYGDKTVRLDPPSLLHHVLLILRILLIPCIIVVLVIVCRWQKKLTAEMKKL
ncbi:plexin-C1-like [Seriola aureovittata]|uniref:plexin-C1-like n=1 Tax=Seriola aureovittata TaxID=2871759 RepID=UPI0024BEB8F3|nr:plexin-C1-like [Seriola aureovittata]